MKHNVIVLFVKHNLFAADGDGVFFRIYLIAELCGSAVDLDLAV